MSQVFIFVGLSYGDERGRGGVRQATGGAREGSEVATKELDRLKCTIWLGGGAPDGRKLSDDTENFPILS